MDLPSRSIRTNGNSIRRLRLERGWTQTELAKRAGYSPRLIGKAEGNGCLDLETIRNIAEALSNTGHVVSVEHLTLDIRSIAVRWMDALNEHGPEMASYISQHLADDFMFDCPGLPETAPFIGKWYGMEGLLKFWRLYFGVFRRVPHKDVTYSVADDLVIARYLESGYLGDQLCGPIRINMVFHFREGLIYRIDDEYDTQAGAITLSKAEKAIERQRELANIFVQCYDSGGRDVQKRCEECFTEDIEVRFDGDPAEIPYAGIWKGIDGVQRFLDCFYSVVTREINSLNPDYVISSDRIVARFSDKFSVRGKETPSTLVNLNFQFRDGLICSIDDEPHGFSTDE